MKNHIIVIVTMLVSYFGNSQDLNIETQSVSIDHLISFVVDHIQNKSDDSESPLLNLTFLLQTPTHDLSTEDKVILKQAFKLISKRLSENDVLSLLTYSGFNGIALKQTSAKDLKGILYAIDNLKSCVKEFHEDGIELAYAYTKENFQETSVNTVIIIRNPKATTGLQVNAQQIETPKKKNNAVLITAIALLPELISVIKD